MKTIRINSGQVGLIFKKGDYNRVVTAGSYWLSFKEKEMVFDMTKPFFPPIDLNILLKDEVLASMLIIVEVADTEIALQYENGNFKAVLTPGRYAFWKGVINYTFVKCDLSKVEITEDVSLVFKRAELVPYIRVANIESFQRGILFIDNKMVKMLEPGEYYFWKNAKEVTVPKVDLRLIQLEISGQEILTKDKAALRINFLTQYKVVDVVKALTENKDYEKQLYLLAQLALREYIGTLTLDELLEKKEAVSDYVMASLKEKVVGLGLEVKDCGVKDIILPGEIKDIMNQVLVAQKKAEANVIMRREETASTRSLLNTAKLMEENAMLFKLKEMEYVEKIADKINNISLSGGNQVVDQLKEIFVPKR